MATEQTEGLVAGEEKQRIAPRRRKRKRRKQGVSGASRRRATVMQGGRGRRGLSAGWAKGMELSGCEWLR